MENELGPKRWPGQGIASSSISLSKGAPIAEASEYLLGMLEAAYRPHGIIPKLVHRIDKETSGLLVVAKTDDLAEQLESSFKEGNVDKEYRALVVGHLHPNK